jgi:hypothetical protein
MTSERATRANRSNAKASTGPRTRAGKARSGQNARKHGLSAAGSNPEVDAEVGRLVELIMGEYGGDEVARDAAKSLAEAQVQVRSVRAYKEAFLRNSVLSRGSDVGEGRDQSADNPPNVIQSLEGLERYERRAFSRRKSALRRFIDLVTRT